MELLNTLNQKWSKGEHVRFFQEPNRPVHCQLSLPQGTSAKIYLHGSHLYSFQDEHANEILFMSTEANYVKIRGGVPVVFPQFGPGELPQHGFARESDEWQVENTTFDPDAKLASITLALAANPTTLAVWPHQFKLTLTTSISFAENKSVLTQTMSVANVGHQSTFSFTSCLHTYYRLRDVRKATVRVVGDNEKNFSELEYFDKLTSQLTRTPQSELVLSGPSDRVYYDAPHNFEIEDAVHKVSLKTEEFADLVAWNCWDTGAKNMADMGNDDWVNYICIEPASVREPIILKPNESWTGSQRISTSYQAKL